MSASGTLSVIPRKEDLIAQHQLQNQLSSSSSLNNDGGDPSSSSSAQSQLYAKCEVDPVKAQDDAMISVALKLREGKMTVNEYSVDEARTTMVRSNYAPDWTRANWSHPLLSGLKNLSCLSSFDLPSQTKQGLVDEKKAIRYSDMKNNNNNNNVDGDEGQDQQQQQPLAITDGTTTGKDESSNNTSTSPSKHTQLSEVRTEVIEREALEHALTHGTPAVVETSPFILAQKALLDLSSETIDSDPQLLALVSAIAQANKHDPRIAGKIAMGETPTIPVEVMIPSIRNSYPVHRKATDALPRPSQIGNYNKGFHDSDIVAYEKIKDELSPEKVKKITQRAAAQPGDDQQQGQEGSSTASEERKSMHDVGYKTWMQKHLDQPAEYEDREKFADYRDQVTSLEGKCMSVSGDV